MRECPICKNPIHIIGSRELECPNDEAVNDALDDARLARVPKNIRHEYRLGANVVWKTIYRGTVQLITPDWVYVVFSDPPGDEWCLPSELQPQP